MHRNFRDDMKTFRKMGAMKPDIVLQFFEQFNLSTIVLSDTDNVWLRDSAGDSSHSPSRSFKLCNVHAF